MVPVSPQASLPIAALVPPPGTERRRRRSDDAVTALHYQLASSRSEAQLEALVLVDESGCLVAGAGAWHACEELAAYAPLLVREGAIDSPTVGRRVASLSSDAFVQPVPLDGCEALICGLGGTAARGESMARAAAGCRRILGG